jgi:hypothetical protein
MDEVIEKENVQHTTQPEQQQIVQPVENEEETPQQIDWKKFKAARAKERQEAEQAKKVAEAKAKEAEALKAALDALVNRPTYQSQPEYQDESEEQRIQRLVDARITEQERKREEEKMKRESEQSLPNAMKTYSDFRDIYTQENCDYLEYHHPELFRSLQNETDSFDKWTRVYNALKRYIPNAASSAKDQRKAEKNMSKPQSMSVGGRTATGDGAPQRLDHAQKQANWSRMVAAMKRVN